MRNQMFWMTVVALGLVACSRQQPPAEDQPGAASDEAPEIVSETAAQQAQPQPLVSQELIEHMHEHAEKMDDIMFALADGNLDEAQELASWLGGHQSPEGLPAEWQPFLEGMREAATSVELAPDLETARAAAEEISTHCQSCHAEAGIVTAD